MLLLDVVRSFVRLDKVSCFGFRFAGFCAGWARLV